MPEQLFAFGVTLIVAVTGMLELFVAEKDPILPVPLGARPMELALFSQVYDVPVTVPLKVTGLVAAPLHSV